MENIDPKVKSLVQAIGKAETGDDPNAYQNRGASGEYGRYQFTEPTWRAYAKDILGDENADITSIENQNKVAYGKVKQLKDQGLNPAQIASIWNSGDANAYKTGVLPSGKPAKGVNQFGVEYDVPGYAAKVSNYYTQLAGQTPSVNYTQQTQQAIGDQRQTLQEQGQPVSVNPNKAEPTFAGGIIRGLIKPIVSTGLTLARGTGLADLLGGKGSFSGGITLKSGYLGDTKDIQSQIEDRATELANKVNTGEISKGRAIAGAIGEAGGQTFDLASLVPIEGAASNIAKSIAGKTATSTGKGLLSKVTPVLKSSAKGAGLGLGMEGSRQLAQPGEGDLGDLAIATAAGGLIQPAAELGVPGLIKGAKSAGKNAPLIKAIATGKTTPEAQKLAQSYIDKEVDRVAQSLPISFAQNQKQILDKTGSNGFSIWKMHKLLPEQVGDKYDTQNIVSSLQPYIDKGQQVINKYAKNETNLFNLDENINNVLSYIDKANISKARKNDLAQQFVGLINQEIKPVLENQKGRFLDAEQLMKLKRVLYNEAGLSEDLVTAGKAGKIVDSPYFKLAQEITSNIDKNASLPAFKKANKTFSDYLSAEMLAKKLNGKPAKSTEGLVGKMMRRSIFAGGGGAIGNIPGAFVGNLAGEQLDRFYTDPSFRTSLFRSVLSNGQQANPLNRIKKNINKGIQKRGTSKVPGLIDQGSGLVDRYKYKPQVQDIGEGFILENGKVRKKEL